MSRIRIFPCNFLFHCKLECLQEAVCYLSQLKTSFHLIPSTPSAAIPIVIKVVFCFLTARCHRRHEIHFRLFASNLIIYVMFKLLDEIVVDTTTTHYMVISPRHNTRIVSIEQQKKTLLLDVHFKNWWRNSHPSRTLPSTPRLYNLQLQRQQIKISWLLSWNRDLSCW